MTTIEELEAQLARQEEALRRHSIIVQRPPTPRAKIDIPAILESRGLMVIPVPAPAPKPAEDPEVVEARRRVLQPTEEERSAEISRALKADDKARRAERGKLTKEASDIARKLDDLQEQRRERFAMPAGQLIKTDDIDLEISRLTRRSDVIDAELKALDAQAPVVGNTREQLLTWW